MTCIRVFFRFPFSYFPDILCLSLQCTIFSGSFGSYSSNTRDKKRKEQKALLIIFFSYRPDAVIFIVGTSMYLFTLHPRLNYRIQTKEEHVSLAGRKLPPSLGGSGPRPRGAAPRPRVPRADRGRVNLIQSQTAKLWRARSRLYRSQILQVNMRLKALAEIYAMHSFAQL